MMMGRIVFGLVALAMLACIAEGMRLSQEEKKFLVHELQDLLSEREPASCNTRGANCGSDGICTGTPDGLKCLKKCSLDSECTDQSGLVCFIPEDSSQGRCRKKPNPEDFKCDNVNSSCTTGCPSGKQCKCVQPPNQPAGESGGHCLPECSSDSDCCPSQGCDAKCSPEKGVCAPPMRRHKPKPCPDGTCTPGENCPEGFTCSCKDPPGGSNQAGATGGKVCIPDCTAATDPCPCPGLTDWCQTECNVAQQQCQNTQAQSNNPNVRRARLVAKMMELFTRDQDEDIEID